MYPKSSTLLLRNCDLPPPLKVFAAGENSGIFGGAVGTETDCGGGPGGGEGGTSDLMKALRRSQTRAREAERMRAEMAKERDYLREALVEESQELLAYRQWVRLLELQVSQMRSGLRVRDHDDGTGGGAIWAVALAVCLGFVFGYKY